MIKAKEEVETQNISGPSSPDTNAPCDSQYDRSSVVDTLTEKWTQSNTGSFDPPWNRSGCH